jgi:succinyl-diaminopimelate desuccinylase
MHTPSSLAERLAEACMQLVATASVTGDERTITDQLEAWARGLPHLDPSLIVRQGNALILGAPDPDRPTVCLVGHTDTVPPAAGAFEPPQRDGDRIIGLGASDMKAGLAVMQVLFERLDWAHLPVAPMIIWYDREEGPYNDNGLAPVLALQPMLQDIDLAIVMEPTDNTLQLGCMGGIQARITFRGQAAHSARPWQGENAVHKAGPFLTNLLNRAHQEVDVQGLTFREAVSVTLAEGGRARNVVPDTFVCNLNYRFVPTAGAQEAALAEINRLAQGAEVEITDLSPAGPVPYDNPVLEHLQAMARLPVLPKQAWTDVARLAASGIDAINFGPGMGAQAHQAGEWVSVAAIVQAYEVLFQLFTVPLGLAYPDAGPKTPPSAAPAAH